MAPSRLSALLRALLVCLAATVLASCAANRIVEISTDKNGQTQTTVYSKYYDAADWLVEGKIGVTFLVDHDHTRMPVVPEWMDAHSGDARGPFFIELHNFTDHPVHIVFSDIKLNGVPIPGSTEGDVLPFKTESLQPGDAPIGNYAMSLIATVTFVVDQARISKTLTLIRRTEEELKKYFSLGATPPYPFASYRHLLRN